MARQTLYRYRKNYNSQNGEDGVIEEILRRLNITCGFCVELGAWDGKHLSNTYHLVGDAGWSALHIEADPEKYAKLLKNDMVLAGRITPVNAFVTATGSTMLDNILAEYQVPHDFELLSIDIDGDDLDVWESVAAYRPKIVIIEIDSDIDPTVSRVLPSGRPERSFANALKLGRERGYVLVCHTGNMLFVADELAGRLGMDEELDDPTSLFCDKWMKRKPFHVRRLIRRMARLMPRALISRALH
jgi:hypothetical protein